MTNQKRITILFSAVALASLILDSKTALSGAAAGMTLCIKTVIPSLFPFLFLCSVLTGTLWGERLRILQFIGRKTGIPNGAETLLITASLGGYPAGAQAVAEAYRSHRLTKADAECLLRFCSNAGPAFLFGVVAQQFENRSMIWALMVIQLLSALFTGILFSNKTAGNSALPIKKISLTSILAQTVKTMGIICGWILLFRILSEFLSHWFLWKAPMTIRILLAGILELSNGCCLLNQIPEPNLRFLICSGFLSFGGICITMQTASVISPLSIKSYLQGKTVQTLISLLLSVLYLRFGWLPLCIFPALLICRKKTVDFHNNSMYNRAINGERNQGHAVS